MWISISNVEMYISKINLKMKTKNGNVLNLLLSHALFSLSLALSAWKILATVEASQDPICMKIPNCI